MDAAAATGRDPKEDYELLKNKDLRRRRRQPGRHPAKTIPLQHHQVMEVGTVLFCDQQDVELGQGDKARQSNALHQDQRPD